MKNHNKNPEVNIPTREKALEILTNLRKEYSDKGKKLFGENEAKTRLLIIDTILESLGWSKKDFNPEQVIKNHGFTDYLMEAEGIPRFIVEAKRIGQTFIYPNSKLKKTDYQLSYIRSSFGQSVSNVIDQAEGYAKETSIAYAVITNGAEWILMQAIPSRNKSINELKCVYFGNLLSSACEFDLFWNLLAKTFVVNSSLEEYFSGINSISSDFAAIPNSTLPEINWSQPKDTVKFVRNFHDYFFGEITDPGRRMMLEKCFVTNPKLSQLEGDLKRTLQDTAPTYLSNATDIAPNYEDSAFLPTESGDKKGRVVLVTGSVGCGKSTFINKVLIESIQKNSSEFNPIIIDLINELDGTSENINEYLWHAIDKKWRGLYPEAYEYETLQKIFGRELVSLRKGSYAKAFSNNPDLLAQKEAELLNKLSELPSEFLEKSWRYYSNQHKKRIVIFLDNIDRTSDLYQQIVYTFAHKLSSQTGATVIITMREGTYFRGRESGFLDVRLDDIVYHLQTPDLVQILSKRIEYVENLENPKDSKKKDNRLAGWRNKPDWNDFYQSSLKYAQVIKSTFLATGNSQALNLLSAISWHNVRYFLELLQDLHLTIGSDIEVWSISYMISALLSTNSIIGRKPVLPNLYYPVYTSYPCYFLKLRLLLNLLHGRHSSEVRRGTPLKTLLVFTRTYAYQEMWTRLAIERMVRERLLECMEIPSESDFTKNYELQEGHSFRASPLAIVMIKQVYFDNIYLLMMGRELPFHKHNAFERFIEAVRDVITLVSEEPLNKASIDLLSESKANCIVARYLVEAFEEEKPISDIAMRFSDVSATEEKLKLMIARLLGIAGVTVPNHLPETIKSEKGVQLSLFKGIESNTLVEERNSIQVPDELSDIQTESRGLAPKIFWAMVELKARGKDQVSGADIASIINQYLVDDINNVEPTNISKALRGKVLQTQSWLITNQVTSRKKLFSLSQEWRSYWEQTFKVPLPTFD